MDDAGAIRPGDHEAALGRELQQRLVARHADRACFGKAAGQDQEIADAAVGAFADGVEDGVGPDDDHGKVDRRIDGGDRGHRFVTEYRAALGIDRHDPSAITGLTQQLHDGAARRRGALAGADHGDAAGREERREVAGGSFMAHLLQHRRRGRTRWPIRSSFSSRAAPTSSGRASRCAACCPASSAAWSGRSSSSTISGRWSCRPAATAWRCGRIPHIGLATVTYLFEGGIFHRDSLGYAQAIRPGDVNWMTAGAGIAHSERTEAEMKPHRLSHARHPDLGGAAQEPRGDGAVLRACRGGEAAGVAGRRRGAAADRRHLWRPHGADDALLADLLRRRGAAGGRQDRRLARARRARRLCRRGRVSPSAIACSAWATLRCSVRRSRPRSWRAPAAPR